LPAELMSMFQSPLSLYVGGVGGTGKSHLQRVVHYMMKAYGRQNRFLFMAPSASAALAPGIGGNTIHAQMGFAARSGRGSGVILGKIPARVHDAELVCVDEISMLWANVLAEISDRFVIAKATDAKTDFGGVDVVLTGDLYQYVTFFFFPSRHIFDKMTD
jgi:hypothetical protein